jgi:hypothetical protein
MFILQLVAISALIFVTWTEKTQKDDLRFVEEGFELDLSTGSNPSKGPGSFNVRVEKPLGVFQLKTNFSMPTRGPSKPLNCKSPNSLIEIILRISARQPLFKLPLFLFGQKFNRSMIQEVMKIKLHPSKVTVKVCWG